MLSNSLCSQNRRLISTYLLVDRHMSNFEKIKFSPRQKSKKKKKMCSFNYLGMLLNTPSILPFKYHPPSISHPHQNPTMNHPPSSSSPAFFGASLSGKVQQVRPFPSKNQTSRTLLTTQQSLDLLLSHLLLRYILHPLVCISTLLDHPAAP